MPGPRLDPEGLTKWVNNATDQGVAYRYRSNTACSTHFVTRFDVSVITHDYDTNGVSLQVEGKAGRAVAKFYKLTSFYVGEAINERDTIVYRGYGTDATCFN